MKGIYDPITQTLYYPESGHTLEISQEGYDHFVKTCAAFEKIIDQRTYGRLFPKDREETILYGKDARRFQYSMEHPTSVSSEVRERMNKNYEELKAIAKFR